jgi:hypothetical protein
LQRNAVQIFICLILTLFAFGQEVQFFPNGGNHPQLQEVRLKVPSGFSVHYTKDGTTPSKYSPKVSESLKIQGNTIFRFAIYDTQNKRSEVVQSYITDRKHTLPIISLVGDPGDFFDSVHGIYAKGCCADTVNPYMGANFWKDWERQINIEFYEPTNECGLNQAAGIKIFGGYSVANPQKSFALYARSKYGEKKFKHPLFPQLPFNKYKNFILRNAGGDMFGAHIRDVFATQVIKSTGLAIQEYRQVVVYINGEYWGKYNMREKINEHYIQAHYAIPKDSLMIMRHNGDRQHGPGTDYRSFIKKLPALDLNKYKDLNYVDHMMDIDNYLLYNIAEIYTGNGDAGGNIRYYKSMQAGGKWRWIYYDLDIGMNINGSNDYKKNSVVDFTTLKQEAWPNPPWSTLIIRKLLENDSIQHRYINLFSDLLNTNYHPDYAKKVLDDILTESNEEIDYHLKRWRILRSRFDKSVADIYLFIEKRPEILRQQLAERFNLEGTCIVRIKPPKKGGKIILNSLEITRDFEGVYFKQVPMHIQAVPDFDYEFIGWKDMKDNQAEQYRAFSQDEVMLVPQFKRKTYSKYAGAVIISEIDAAQDEEIDSGDWIEIYNNSDQRILLKQWFLMDELNSHRFEFPSIYLEPHTHLVIVQDSLKFMATYPGVPFIGSLGFGFKKNKDKIRLYDDHTLTVDEIDLPVFQVEELHAHNWARIDYRQPGFIADNWTFERPTPANISLAYHTLLEKEKQDAFLKSVFFYSGISAFSLIILLFLVPLLRKNKTVKRS